jgi:hypothetical protein
MTASAGALPLVFDTTCLSRFARADRLDVLGDLLIGSPFNHRGPIVIPAQAESSLAFLHSGLSSRPGSCP